MIIVQIKKEDTIIPPGVSIDALDYLVKMILINEVFSIFTFFQNKEGRAILTGKTFQVLYGLSAK